MNDFHSMLDNTNSHELFSIVSPVHHQRVGQSLDNGALCLPETLDLVPTSSMGHVGCMLGCSCSNIVFHRNVTDLQRQVELKKINF